MKLGGSFPKLSYKNLQTIKHALQEYLKRDGITENDKTSEQALLLKINDEIKLMRERHRF
ncbi:DNA strand exchange inhibitor protein [Lysinibacillus sp. AR18-8]|nr:DNA strand exchange inhibitor protein [Lysinibacillus sp. AR18-8]